MPGFAVNGTYFVIVENDNDKASFDFLVDFAEHGSTNSLVRSGIHLPNPLDATTVTAPHQKN